MTLKLALSCDALMEESWNLMANSRIPFYGVDRRHEDTIQFLIDMTEFAEIYIYSGGLHFDMAQVCIINWTLGTRDWVVMHDLVEMLHFVSKMPEDADVFVSDDMIDWSEDVLEPFDTLIREWQAQVALGPRPLEHPELLARNQPIQWRTPATDITPGPGVI